MQKILSRVIFIGFSVQIILGIFWMTNAFAGLSFGEGIVCVGSTTLFGVAVFFVKQSVWGKGTPLKDVFTVLSVLSFPFVMQALVNPDNRTVITIIMLFVTAFVLRVMRKHNGLKAVSAILCLGVLSVGIVIGAQTITQGWTPISIRWTERIAWTTLYKSFNRMPDESWYAIDYFKMGESTHEVLGVRDILVPSLIEDLGEEKAADILAELRALSWQYEKKQVIKEIIWDAVGYTFSPIVLQLQLEGRAYESYSGINYRELLQSAPELGKIYTKYSCWWFVIALISGMLIVVENWIRRKIRISGRKVLAVATAGLSMIIWYTLDGAGRMDYKNTLFVLCLWLILASGASMWSLAAEQSMGHLGGNQDEEE